MEKRTQSTVGGNFILSTATFTVNVSGAAKQNQSIAFNQPAPKTYGAADFALGATASSNLPVSYSSSTTDVCTIVDGKVHVVSAGNCTVTATQAGNASYNSATPATGTFAINKADLTVVTNDQTKKFGEANPALTGSVNGLQYSDSITASRSTTADENSDVGAYPIAATLSDPGNKLDNYNVTNNGGTLTVEKAAATLSLNELGGHTYDGQPQGATVATSPAGLGGVSVTYDGGQTRPTDAGSYAVVASLDNPNYQAQDATGTMVIDKASPQITWSNPADITYGTQLGTAQLNASADVAGSFSYSPASGTKLDAGDNHDLKVDFTPNDAGNYNGASRTVQINVDKANQSIDFGPIAPKTFGDADFALDASADSGLGVSFASTTPDDCSVGGGTVSILGAGTCTIEASQGGNNNYNAATSVSRSFEISKAQAQVSLSDLSKTYNGSPQGVTVGTTPANLDVNVTYDGAAQAPTNAGSYAVVATVNEANYEGSAEGTLVINKAKATLSLVADDLSQVYTGSPRTVAVNTDPDVPNKQINVTYDGAAQAPTDAGSYSVVASLAEHANYFAEDVEGTLEVAKAPAELSFAVGTLSKTYDGTPQDVSVATSPAGLGGVSVTYDGGQTRPTDAGSYAVVASLDNPNYQAQDANDTLTIARKALSITASDDRREYGDPNPALTGVLSGDVAGDNISASYATAATEASDAGAYPIVPSLNDPNSRLSNYDVSKTDGTLTVTKAALGATAANAEKVYGDALGVSNLTGSVTGVKNGDPIKVSYFSAGAASTSDVGAYPIVPALDATAAVLANYHDPILTNGTLSVTKAPLVIKADDASRFYDDPNPVFTGSVVSGVKNGDVLNLSFTTTALQNSPVGTYAIVPEAGGAKVGNYLVRAHNGTLTIGSWTFKGFYQPVDMSGTLNTVKGGSTVPIKFELFKGTTELTDTASINQPLKAAKVACDTGATVDAIELVATGGTALRYDATGGQFIYNWKTPTAAGACYKVTITANDGSSQTASFKIK